MAKKKSGIEENYEKFDSVSDVEKASDLQQPKVNSDEVTEKQVAQTEEMEIESVRQKNEASTEDENVNEDFSLPEEKKMAMTPIVGETNETHVDVVKPRKKPFQKSIDYWKGKREYFKKLKPLSGKERAKMLGSSTLVTTKRLSKRWFIDAFTGMAQGLFVTLIAGTIIKQIGTWIGKETKLGMFLITIGTVASFLMGAGIGAGIATHLKAPRLVIFACIVAGLLGAFSDKFLAGTWLTGNMLAAAPGNPISSYICALIACEVGKFLSGRTKIDILVVPLTVLLVAFASTYVCIPFIKLIDLISRGIGQATTAMPIPMGIIIAVVVGILLTMPTSSAAICITLGLGGIAGGAAVVGCACHMVGFAVQSFRENKYSGLISQGLGTSMLQIPNIMKKPILLVPPIIASAIAGPLATSVFGLQCAPAGSGMGTCGFVGIITTIQTSMEAGLAAWKIGVGITLLFFVIPIVVCLLVSELMRKFNLIKFGDMQLDYEN